MEKNSSMSGQVLAALTLNVGQNGYNANQIASALVAKLGTTAATGSVIGAGYYNGTAAALLYKVESVKKAEQAASKISTSVKTVYSDAGKVKNPVTNKMSAADEKQVTDGVSSSLLTGDKGTAINEQVLKTIFAGLAGDTTALEGQASYYDDNGKVYHYQFWLDGKDSAEKLANFLKLTPALSTAMPSRLFTRQLWWLALTTRLRQLTKRQPARRLVMKSLLPSKLAMKLA